MIYYAELDEEGEIKYLEVSDGQYYYQYKENKKDKLVNLDEEDPDIKMNYIKDNIVTEKVFVYNAEYEIYDITNKVPVIMTNVGDFDVKVRVSFNGNEYANFVLSKNIEDHMVFIEFTEKQLNSLRVNSTYSLKIDTEVVIGQDAVDGQDIIVKYPYSDKVKFKRVNPDMIITGVTATKNNDKIAYNQTGVFVPRNINVEKLNVNVKNQSDKTYKFHNIKRDELIGSQVNNKIYQPVRLPLEEESKYENYLMGGIYFYNLTNNNFDMTFGAQENVQKIHFDFDVFINPGVFEDGNISISSKENSNENQFGSFNPFPLTGSTPHGSIYCNPISKCFGDGKYNYENGGLKFGLGYETASLNKAQSMGVDTEYSVYMTFLPDSTKKLNQRGVPASGYPATLLAISQADTIYLSWIGIYEGYLQVYSYYNGQSRYGQRGNETVKGFTSFDISEYSGKIINLQVTARRNGTTRVYINGVEKKAFNSGSDFVKYSIATIGDLRPSRGLKYSGIIYDVALYNSELSSDAVIHNWNYAKNKWNIN